MTRLVAVKVLIWPILGPGWFLHKLGEAIWKPETVADLLVNLFATFLSVPLLVIAGVFLHSRKLRKHYVAAMMKTFGLSRAQALRALRDARSPTGRAGSLGSIIARGANLRDETDALTAYLQDLARKSTGDSGPKTDRLIHPPFSEFYENLTDAFASCWILRSRYGQYRAEADRLYH